MARIRLEGDDVVVRLRLLEKLGAFHRNVRVPRSAVREVTVTPKPFRRVRGIGAPRTGIPRVIALGTWRRFRGKDFVALYRKRPAVIVELNGQDTPYRRLLVSVESPELIQRALQP